MVKLPSSQLPILESLDVLISRLADHNRVVLVAPPGAGKTTHVPLALLNQSWLKGRKIIVLEPRRIAARSAARYMASVLNERVGETVGYRVRSDTRTSSKTRIELVTEGVFSRMALSDAELNNIGAVLFDEFHERNLEGDLSLAMAIDIQEGLREDLRILPMSATLDGDRLARLLGNAPIVESKGRSFPVDVMYDPRKPDVPVHQAVAGAVRSALSQFDGDVLAFVPGIQEIKRTVELLSESLSNAIEVHPLHGGLKHAEQDKAIKPAKGGNRKVVVATSIAETSLTIDGIRIVVDSGLARVPRFDPSTGLTVLKTERASLSSVEQRSGRAGRTQPGTAIRLWHEGQNGALSPFPRPEILEADLSSMVLALAAWGVQDAATLKWLDPPPKKALKSAVQSLQTLGALDKNDRITAKGIEIQKLSYPPNLSNMIHVASWNGNRRRALELATILTERGLGGNDVDISSRLARFLADSSKTSQSLKMGIDKSEGRQFVEKTPSAPALSDGAILSLAFPDRIAKSRGREGQFQLANGRGANLELGSPLASSDFLVVAELQGSASNARIMSAASTTFPEIEMLHGDYIRSDRKVTFDPGSGQVRAVLTTRLNRILLNQSPVQVLPEDDPGDHLCEAVREHGLDLLKWETQTIRDLDRLRYLHRLNPDEWPDVSPTWLQSNTDIWLRPFLSEETSIAQIKPETLKHGIEVRVGYSLMQKLEQVAPGHFHAPSGSRIPVQYRDGEVVIAIRVQEIFGLKDHPTTGGEPIVLELLSPANRLLQKTANISAFWQNSWKDVRADMRGRYPKHYWPEDAASAAPTSRAKPRKR